MSFCLYGLIELAPLIHLIFYKNKMRRLGQAFIDIIRQIISSGLKKPGIFKNNQTAFRKKGQCLCKVNHLFDICFLPFITGIVHGVPLGNHGFDEALFILFLQISLRAVQEVYLSKLSRFQIFIQAFHNSCIIKEGNPV